MKLGVWVHLAVRFSSLKKKVSKLVDINFNIVPVIRNTSELVNYPSRIALIFELVKGFNILEQLVKILIKRIYIEKEIKLEGFLINEPGLAMTNYEEVRINLISPLYEKVREYEISAFKTSREGSSERLS